MKFVKRKAFSLIELSIVIIIIAIMIAGTVQAIEMFSEASIKSARNLSKLSRVSRIEDLTLWLDATASEAFDKEKDDNSTVSVWKDTNAGASSIISSSSSSASLYPSYALSAINKLPAVSFKKTSSLIGNCATVPNGSFVNSTEDFTLYLIFSPKSLDDGIIIEKNNDSATTFPFSLELFSGSYKFSVKNSIKTISVISPKQPKINTPNLIRLSRIKGSQIEIAIDEISSTETDTLTSSTLNNAELAIGCRNGNTPANFINGDIGETAFYNRNLNLKDKSDIEEYLYKKWKMKKFEGTLPATITPLPANTCLVSAGTGYSAKSQLSIGSGTFSCDEAGYSGTINYTCPSSGGTATITGSCTANTCSVTAGTGYIAKPQLFGSGSFPCDEAGYSGTINYTCPSSGGTATITGSCTANTCSVTAGTGYIAKPQLFGSGSFPCDEAGYNGTINYTCPSSGGTATITGSCTANTCTVSQGTGYAAKTLLPIGLGSFFCDAGYTGTINYNCPSSGGTATITGSCTANTCTVSEGTGYTTKTLLPIGLGSFSCDAGYTGTINYNCPSSGGTVNGTGTCTANTCSVTAGTGYTAKSQLSIGSGTFPCDVAGYTGTINYNCPSDGGFAKVISGSCTPGCLYTEAGGVSRCLLNAGDTRQFSIGESTIILCPYGASGNSQSNPPQRDMKYKCYANGTSKFGIRRRCSWYIYFNMINYTRNPQGGCTSWVSDNNWSKSTNGCTGVGESTCPLANKWLETDTGTWAW